MGSNKPVYVRSHLRSGTFVNAYLRSLPTRQSYGSSSRRSGCLSVVGILLKITIWVVGLSLVLVIVLGLLLVDLVAYFGHRGQRSPEKDSLTASASAGVNIRHIVVPPAPPLTTADIKAGAIFCLVWIMANSIAGGFSDTLLVLSRAIKDEPLRGFAAPGLVGLAFGVLQGLVLRTKLQRFFWWLLATFVGMYIAALSGIFGYVGHLLSQRFDAITGKDTVPISVPTIIMTAGVMFGLCQWLVLLRKVNNSWLWIIVSAIGWSAAGFFFVDAVGSELNAETVLNIYAWLIAGSLFGVITGAPLFFLTRKPVLGVT